MSIFYNIFEVYLQSSNASFKSDVKIHFENKRVFKQKYSPCGFSQLDLVVS
jgi:hypothetical protein